MILKFEKYNLCAMLEWIWKRKKRNSIKSEHLQRPHIWLTITTVDENDRALFTCFMLLHIFR